jgi:hypothetical protein
LSVCIVKFEISNVCLSEVFTAFWVAVEMRLIRMWLSGAFSYLSFPFTADGFVSFGKEHLFGISITLLEI